MYLSIVFLPLFGAICGGLFGRYLGVKGVKIFTSVNMCIVSLLSIVVYLLFLKLLFCFINILNMIRVLLFEDNSDYLFISLV